MRRSDRQPTSDVRALFESLVRELDAGGYLLAVGSESRTAPYVQILNRPERRSLAPALTAANRTMVRLVPAREYLAYLDTCFPRLYDRLLGECHPDRPFLVVERWVRYVDLGKRLLGFGRDHGLNLRCVDYARGESRINGLRIVFDHATYRWRIADGSVDELLQDPRRGDRSWLASMNPRWPLHRMAGRLNFAARRAAGLVLP
jgi:hypothetical protein